MTLYYDHAGITIYHGDCREILPSLNKVQCIVSDPPYGIGYQHSGGGYGIASNRNSNIPIYGDDSPFDPSWMFNFDPIFVLLFGADHFCRHLPSGGTFIAWDKHCGQGPNDSFADCEFAWCSKRIKRNVIRCLWKGISCVKAGEENGRRFHPTQKPQMVMKRCVLECPDDVQIFDPYMGAGSTLVAAKHLGRQAVGIEIEERYCEIAANRLAQDRLF